MIEYFSRFQQYPWRLVYALSTTVWQWTASSISLTQTLRHHLCHCSRQNTLLWLCEKSVLTKSEISRGRAVLIWRWLPDAVISVQAHRIARHNGICLHFGAQQPLNLNHNSTSMYVWRSVRFLSLPWINEDAMRVPARGVLYSLPELEPQVTHMNNPQITEMHVLGVLAPGPPHLTVIDPSSFLYQETASIARSRSSRSPSLLE
jgi:hypothetical protein